MEYFLTTCGALALEGGPIFWVATHRIHHQHSDKDGDPHTPREGAFWAHMGWIMFGKAMHHDTSVLKRYVPDLSRDRYHVALTTWHWVPQVVVGLALLAYGGLPYVLWGDGAAHDLRPALHLAGQLGDAHVGLRAGSAPATTRPTCGGWRSSASARAGTTTTTRTRCRCATAWPGTNST